MAPHTGTVQSGTCLSSLLFARDAADVTDWKAWHDAYDEPGSSLAHRLDVVRRRLDEVLDMVPRPAPRILALCSGEARDVVPVLAGRADGAQVQATLIEFDVELASRAARAVKTAGLGKVVVRCADAGDPTSFTELLPVHVLMLCGIFGNVEHESVAELVRAVPTMVFQGGYVIWTRGGGPPVDHRPEVRRWFIEAGMPECSFDGEPEKYGVGVNHIITNRGLMPEGRLFTFRTAAPST